MRNELGKLPFGPGKLFIAENYLESVGIMTAEGGSSFILSATATCGDKRFFRAL